MTGKFPGSLSERNANSSGSLAANQEETRHGWTLYNGHGCRIHSVKVFAGGPIVLLAWHRAQSSHALVLLLIVRRSHSASPSKSSRSGHRVFFRAAELIEMTDMIPLIVMKMIRRDNSHQTAIGGLQHEPLLHAVVL